jgi:hypothetical protein
MDRETFLWVLICPLARQNRPVELGLVAINLTLPRISAYIQWSGVAFLKVHVKMLNAWIYREMNLSFERTPLYFASSYDHSELVLLDFLCLFTRRTFCWIFCASSHEGRFVGFSVPLYSKDVLLDFLCLFTRRTFCWIFCASCLKALCAFLGGSSMMALRTCRLGTLRLVSTYSSSVKVRNGGTMPSHKTSWHGAYLIKLRDNFTFQLTFEITVQNICRPNGFERVTVFCIRIEFICFLR